MAPKQKPLTEALVAELTWDGLNALLMQPAADESFCNTLLNLELAGKRRRQYALRIWSRLNRLRGQREKAELGRGLVAKRGAV